MQLSSKHPVGKFYGRNRADWLEKTLKQIPEGSRILDAGAGELKHKPSCGHLRYVSQDFGEYTGSGNGIGYQKGTWDNSKLDIISDIIAIPEPDASFDAIMCVEVFEHIPAPLQAIREFERLLRPGGTLVITAPFCSFTHFSPHFYYTGFSPHFYNTHLGGAFDVVELTPNGNMFEYMAQEIRRLPEVAQRYASIKLAENETAAIDSVLGILQRCTEQDRGSAETLCIGYFVRAVKK